MTPVNGTSASSNRECYALSWGITTAIAWFALAWCATAHRQWSRTSQHGLTAVAVWLSMQHLWLSQLAPSSGSGADETAVVWAMGTLGFALWLVICRLSARIPLVCHWLTSSVILTAWLHGQLPPLRQSSQVDGGNEEEEEQVGEPHDLRSAEWVILTAMLICVALAIAILYRRGKSNATFRHVLYLSYALCYSWQSLIQQVVQVTQEQQQSTWRLNMVLTCDIRNPVITTYVGGHNSLIRLLVWSMAFVVLLLLQLGFCRDRCRCRKNMSSDSIQLKSHDATSGVGEGDEQEEEEEEEEAEDNEQQDMQYERLTRQRRETANRSQGRTICCGDFHCMVLLQTLCDIETDDARSSSSNSRLADSVQMASGIFSAGAATSAVQQQQKAVVIVNADSGNSHHGSDGGGGRTDVVVV